ncbi:MAG: DUF2752 domain-containing protein [Planctomycetes bacterium]|nr:DUF2752 domain-containing protein [Planctomycetota bacterium]
MAQEQTITKPRSSEHWILLAGSIAGFCILLCFGLFVTPDPRGYGTHTHLGLPDCMTIEWWGVPCPGCGVTTSVCLAAHGQLLASLHNQPLGLACALLLAVAPLWAVRQHFAGRDLYAEVGRIVFKPWLVVGALFVLGAWAWKIGLVRHWWS